MPVFITLIECDPKDQNARYHAQLGFSLKDMLPADLINAKTELDKAIAIRDRLKQGDKYVYEFARAFANIQLGSKNDVIKKDLEAAMNDPMLRDPIQDPHPLLGEPLVKWLRNNQAELQEWIERMKIKLPVET